MSNSFFNEIIYSSSNEDTESERKALKINPDDTILCITGSGARPLDLLVDSPKKIISIDFNETQNFLLELKIAAFKVLNYDECIRFLGIGFSINRLQVFNQLKPQLSDKAIAFWTQNLQHIEKGPLYCGKWERILKGLLRLSFFRKQTIQKLIHASSIEEQKKLWHTISNHITWKVFLKIISNRFLWMYIIREPGAKLIPKTFDVYKYISSRIDYLVNNFILKENHYANLLFNGSYLDSCILPHHLRKENFELIKSNIDKIEITTGSLSDYLLTQQHKISAFSLSDFSSYAPDEMYHSIWKNILFASTDHAKFCERLFLVKRNPEQQFHEIKRDTLLEAQLFVEDEVAIYTFCVGNIIKNTRVCQ
jgi:S-adenosylmethionine-diacylglycerol 3-amino-3-carboxypropyl transferase